MEKEKLYLMSFAKLYPCYVNKAERKARLKSEVDQILRWLTGYNQEEIEAHIEKQTDLETFFKDAINFNPLSQLVKGLVCGVRVEEVEDPIIQKIRILDKLVDELARGKSMEKIMRKPL
jgi:hypothetical protein